MALLKLPNDISVHLPFDIFHRGVTPDVGSSVACLGYPFGNFGNHVLKITSGIISSKVQNENGTNQYQIDAMIHESNSGGPLVDLASNKVIGIVSGRFSPAGGQGGLMLGNYQIGSESSIGLAVTAQYALELLKAEGL
ncbi:trypsin-like peptidase domain-containing protein [Aeromonas veronii]